ncbi:MAG: Gfo/Idh/MocA family oxidoreductase [Kosmotoga sp.]|uniref:Gfo/Idh/MocA family protein n=1 Tax=Kosmotoga sp. TaxID=1955248 RepID=UPI001D332F30|nr:Gfo/Idh/MocA family oxidoreductase [Kosmotoga sp.]MBO8166797.1 Gfo/Idh/MocA family oxidoreductase [Kosmotoga sp.]
MIKGHFFEEGKKLKYGMVGGGPGSFIGPVHRAAIAMNGQAQIVAGSFSPIYDETLMTAKELGISEDRAYRSYEEMAEKEAQRDDGIDFVSITVPNYLHYKVAKAFLEKGINIVCEKPLCFTPKEAKELMELAAKNDVEFMVTYTYTGYPMIREARNIVQNNTLGNIRLIIAEYPQGWLAEPIEKEGQTQASWRTDPKYAGISNCVGDIGTHIENLAHFITDLEITSLSARLETFVEGRKLDDNAFILLKYENDASGSYWPSQIAIGNENSLKIRIYGTEGSLEWEQEHPNFLKLSMKGEPLKILSRGNDYLSSAAQMFTRLPSGHPEGYFEAFANLYRSFCNKLSAKKAGEKSDELFPTVVDGARGVKFVHDCVNSSNKGGEWVDASFEFGGEY